MMVGAALLVFTGHHRRGRTRFTSAVPLAITVALIIATMKGSMVAAVFMHLSHEKKWIYGALLLTVVVFLVLMTVPIFTTMDTIGTHVPAIGGAPAARARGALNMSLRAFHLFFIAHLGHPRGVLRRLGGRAVFGRQSTDLRRRRPSLSLCGAAGLAVYAAAFQRKTKGLYVMTRLRLLVLSWLVLARAARRAGVPGVLRPERLADGAWP